MSNEYGIFDTNVKIVRQVTLPILKKSDGVPIYVQFKGLMFTGKRMPKDAPDKEPATLAPVINLEDGTSAHLICNAALKNNLEENYPKGGYVGRFFRIIQSKVDGVRWKNFNIAEIADPSVKEGGKKQV